MLAGGATPTGLTQLSSTLTQHVHVCAPHKRERLLLRFLSSLRQNEKASGTRARARVLVFVNTVKAARVCAAIIRKGAKEVRATAACKCARACAHAREVRSFAHEEDTQVWFPFLQTHSQYQQPIVLASAGA